MWQVSERVDLLMYGHLLDGRNAWHDCCTVRWNSQGLGVSVTVSVPVSVSVPVPVPGAVLTVSVSIPVSPVKNRATGDEKNTKKYEDFVNIFGLGLRIVVNSKLQIFTVCTLLL